MKEYGIFNLDKKWIYVFIRQDLFSWQQLVHVFHSGLIMGMQIPGMVPPREKLTGHPTVVVIGQPNLDAIIGVCEDLRSREIAFKVWEDPDSPQDSLLAIVTEPLIQREKNLLHSYRPWSERNNTHPKASPKGEDNETRREASC